MFTLTDLDVAGKRVLVRVDFNVPMDEDGSIGSDRRIQAALGTINEALKQGARLVLMSHLGRPGGKPDPRFQMDPVAERLSELLTDTIVNKCDEVVGETARKMADKLKDGDLLLLENLRFHPGEKEADKNFARQLAALGEIYINDAFATCHRKDASMYVVPKQFSRQNRGIGLLVKKETETLDRLLSSPNRPLVAILGGAKVSDKVGVIEALLEKADQLLIGGATAYTFLKAQGTAVGNSRAEENMLEQARELLERAGQKLLLPADHLITDHPEYRGELDLVERDERIVAGDIPEGWTGVDIGPETIERYCAILRDAATVVWNGPVGKFEDASFRTGTEDIARVVADSRATTVLGGGETGEAVEQLGLVERFAHVSTGGGAFLEYLRKRSLPALEVLEGGD